MDDRLNRIYKSFLNCTGAQTDTRKLEAGQAYFALKGKNFDGNDFAGKALEMGAGFAVVDDQRLDGVDRMFCVENVLDTLQQMAFLHRQNNPLPMLAITGSNGKTTTKELIVSVLSSKYRISSTPGNLNNHIGLPVTILNIDKNAEMLVVEMGANHRGEIQKLCEIAVPDHGIITNIGKAHLEGFGGFEGVVKAKNELYDHIRVSGGKVFVNRDNKLLMKLSEGIPRITYGTDEASDYRIMTVSASPFLQAEVPLKGSNLNIRSNLYGEYNLENIAAAIAVGFHFGVPHEKLVRAIEEYNPQNMRSQLVLTNSNKIYLDAYNANPTSMKNAIEFFAVDSERPSMVILGDMLELGKDSEAEHKEILSLVRKLNFDKVLLVGREFCSFCNEGWLKCYPDNESLEQALRESPPKGYNILVKGSRGIGLEKALDFL
jgi:UDP-N-acetylmuramoyl-tripeptide--D-alanyl-D-alanine ligase